MVAVALGFCGLGIGLAVPVLTRVALHQDAGIVRSGAITVAARHAGLVLGLALIAPLLTTSLDQRRRARAARRDEGDPRRQRADPEEGADRARAPRRAENAQKGEVPDLGKPFDDAGARDHANVRRARDDARRTR